MRTTMWAALAVMAACAGDDTTKDSGETGATDGDADTDTDSDADADPTVDSITASCSGTTITYSAGITGSPDTAMIYAVDAANVNPWGDNNDLTGTDWSVALADGTTLADPTVDYERNVSTVFTCADHIDAGVMSYAVAIFDAAGAQIDCLATGDDAASLIDSSIEGFNAPDFDISACHE
ncbi:MAG: hypothetical protein ABMB14_07310 [Myxococcota bacterium]